MWKFILKEIPVLLIGVVLGYLVRPVMGWFYPKTRLMRRLVMSMNDQGADIFIGDNRMTLPVLVLDNLTPFKLNVTQVTIDITASGQPIGTTTAPRSSTGTTSLSFTDTFTATIDNRRTRSPSYCGHSAKKHGTFRYECASEGNHQNVL